MKKLLIILVVLAALYAVVKLSIKSPDQSIPSATEQTDDMDSMDEASAPTGATITRQDAISPDRIAVMFHGFGPAGKEEFGSVQASESTLVRTGNIFSGSVTFDITTITDTNGKQRLETDLKGSGFFDVAKYPTATFAITSATDSQVKGNLTMKGITKPVTLPLTVDPTTYAYSTTVRINMEDFGIKQTFADKEFVLTATIK